MCFLMEIWASLLVLEMHIRIIKVIGIYFSVGAPCRVTELAQVICYCEYLWPFPKIIPLLEIPILVQIQC